MPKVFGLLRWISSLCGGKVDGENRPQNWPWVDGTRRVKKSMFSKNAEEEANQMFFACPILTVFVNRIEISKKIVMLDTWILYWLLSQIAVWHIGENGEKELRWRRN